jgi:hypothetical protein
VQERETARQALAKSQLDLAEKEFGLGKFVEAKKILAETPESFRDANWRFLDTHSRDCAAQLSIPGKGGCVCAAVFAPGRPFRSPMLWADVIGVFTVTFDKALPVPFSRNGHALSPWN